VLFKYVLLMLRADDNGEGGIMALYALIKHAAHIRTVSEPHEADLGIASFNTFVERKTSGPVARLRGDASPPRSPRLPAVSLYTLHMRSEGPSFALLRSPPPPPPPPAGWITRSRGAQGVLLGLVLAATNLIIADGILTPAISVISAVQGIQYSASISSSEPAAGRAAAEGGRGAAGAGGAAAQRAAARCMQRRG
jgi:KUP system potassium uptake protein